MLEDSGGSRNDFLGSAGPTNQLLDVSGGASAFAVLPHPATPSFPQTSPGGGR